MDLFGPVIMAVHDNIAGVKQRLASLGEQTEQHPDEIAVLTGRILRYAGEPIAWSGLQNELRRPRERVEGLERKG